MRELSQQELNDNYMASYSNGAAEGAADTFSLYPRDFVEDSLPAGQDGINDYAEKNYFSNLKH